MKDTYLQYGIVAKECGKIIDDLSSEKLEEKQAALKEIPALLGGLRRWYEQARSISPLGIKDKAAADKSQEIATLVSKESIVLLEELFEKMQSMQNQGEVSQALMRRVTNMMCFFRAEMSKFDMETQQVSLANSVNSDQQPRINPFFLEKCCEDLSIAVEADLQHFSLENLQKLSAAHGSSYLDARIVQRLLQESTTIQLAERVRLAVDLLWRDIPHYGHSMNDQRYPVEMRETLSDITFFKRSMVNSLDSFLAASHEHIASKAIKCNLVRACIEEKLRQSPSNKPWQLGWAGSRHRIAFEGKIYYVPKGISDLYASVKPTQAEANWERVAKLTERAPSKPGSFGSFISSLFGCGRGRDTQRFYEELQDRMNSQNMAKALYSRASSRVR